MLNMTWLSLSGYSLTKIDKDFLRGNAEMIHLFLNFNQLERIECGALDSLSKLRYLDLTDNELTELDECLFKSNVNLENLFLSDNKIKILHSRLFKANVKMTRIWMENQIVAIFPKTFENLKNSIYEWNFLSNYCVDCLFRGNVNTPPVSGKFSSCYNSYNAMVKADWKTTIYEYFADLFQ